MKPPGYLVNNDSLDYKQIGLELNINFEEEPAGLNFPNNAPGLYIAPFKNDLVVIMNTFKNMNEKLNDYIIEKVNDIKSNDYDITTSFLPQKNEPQGVTYLDNNEYSNYMDL